MLKKLATVVLAGVVLAAVAGVVFRPAPIMPACETEDVIPSDGACYWNAGLQGNGTGSSFIAYDDGRIEYTD